MFVPRTLQLFSLAALVLLGTGCSDGRPSRVPVSGQVLIDGQPVTRGTVQVIPQGDRAAYADIGPDGRFRLSTFEDNDGCVLGKHKVVVVSREVINAGSQKWLVPKKYSSFEDSDLRIDVTGPTDTLKIELTWAGGKPFVETLGQE
jgi:hypothetical protein